MAGRMHSERHSNWNSAGHSNWITQGEIMGTLKTYKKFSVSKEETFKNIITDFSLSEEYARNYMEKYW